MVAVAGLVKRALPGAAVAAVAMGTVVGLDRGFTDPTEGNAGPGGLERAGEQQGLDPAGGAEAAPTPTAGSAPDAGCAATIGVTGAAADTPWGPVQVAAEVAADGTLCDVSAVVYPNRDRKSASINAYAIPVLDAAATAEGIRFDAVSGATYTSEAYRDSLQALLDSL